MNVTPVVVSVLGLIVVELVADAVGPLGMPSQVSRGELSRRSDVIYGRRAGLALTMEVYEPAKPNGLGIVWVVSSNGMSSREQTLTESFERRIAPLVERGYSVFAAIHGTPPAFQLRDFAEDVRRAVRFVRHESGTFGVDGGRLALAGSSSGGFLALLVAMTALEGERTAVDPVERVSTRVEAVGAFFAPTDFLNFGARSANILELMQQRAGAIDPSFQFYELDKARRVRTPILDRERQLELLRELSPVYHVTADDPPTLLIHGDQDTAVPVQQSPRLMEQLSAANVTARLVVREGMGHAWSGWESEAALLVDWFDAHLSHGR